MPNASREPTPTPLHVAIKGRAAILDPRLREATDRVVRFDLARFGPAVRTVGVTYSCAPGDLPVCAIRVGLTAASSIAVKQHGGTPERALRGALRLAAFEIARELHARSQQRLSRGA